MTLEFEVTTIGEVIKYKMLEKDYSITKLEEETGIDKAVLSRNINNENEPRITTVIKIAKVLDLDLNILKELNYEEK